ncbi:MAG: DUF2207 domain-containing protein [Acidobacteria bacterium]|nr:MAG: DUF2207 domain-containing protein [Acidobacteriota bacterium]
MRRHARFALVIGVLLLFVTTAYPKSYQASRYDVELAVEAGGDLHVTETIDYRFEGGPFTYVFLEVPLTESDGLHQFQGFLDGRELRIGAGEVPGLELQTKNKSVRVIWHFQPTSDSSHTLVIKYRARRAVRRDEGRDLLLWRAVRGDRSYRIESARVSVICPPGIRLAGEPDANRKSAIRQAAGVIVYEVGRLNKERGFNVNVPFPQGSILSRPPLWQQQAERRSEEIVEAFKVALAAVSPLLLVGILLVVRLRPAHAVPKAAGPTVVTTPPDNLSPALVGAVRGSWSDWRVALATLIDLGQRGFLEIEAQPKTWTGRDFKLRRTGGTGELTKVDQVLLRLAFGTNDQVAPVVPIRKVQRQVWRHWGEFTRALREEARAAGFLDSDRESTRKKWTVSGLITMLLALTGVAIALVATIPQGRLTPIVVAVVVGSGVFTLGLVVLGLGSSFTRLTDAALARKHAWDAFRKHLKELASRKSQLHPDWLASYLPYAVVLGLGSQWAKAFKDRGLQTHLSWLAGTEQFEGSEVAALVAVLSLSGAGHSSPGGGGGGARGGGARGGGGSSGAG